MNGTWFCSERCAGQQASTDVDRVTSRDKVRTRALPRLKLGLLLVHQGAITPVQLREALVAQQDSGRLLGQELQSSGTVDRQAIVKALAAQAGIPCLPNLEVTAARWCPELGAHAVRALGLVPIGVDSERQHVKVACAAPVPRLALSALRELTGWTAEPFLVPDATMDGLMRAYAELADVDARDQVVDRDAAGRQSPKRRRATTTRSSARCRAIRTCGYASPAPPVRATCSFPRERRRHGRRRIRRTERASRAIGTPRSTRG